MYNKIQYVVVKMYVTLIKFMFFNVSTHLLPILHLIYY